MLLGRFIKYILNLILVPVKAAGSMSLRVLTFLINGLKKFFSFLYNLIAIGAGYIYDGIKGFFKILFSGVKFLC
jgi:hypothetical protein